MAPPPIVRCAAPGCSRKYPYWNSLYRHWRTNHSGLTGELTRSNAWGIPINQGVAVASGGTGNAVGVQMAPQVTVGGNGSGTAAIVSTTPTTTAAAAAAAMVFAAPFPAAAPFALPPPPASPSASLLTDEEWGSEWPPRYLPSTMSPPPNPLLGPLFGGPSDGEQLRSSRSTRNQDHNTAPRNRAGVIDWDPTDGLPVRKWEQVTVKVNQDATSDPVDANNQSTESNENDFPWPEQPVPSFFHQLPPYSQELLRRARMGNTNITPSEWDWKKEEWIPSAEVEARNARLKSKHLQNNADTPASNEDEENGDEQDGIDTEGVPEKRRKTNSGLAERTFEIKKWVQVPAAIAEKLPEPKYLADRRPGMESLYGGAYKATNGFGSLGLNPGAGSGATGFDLGDGSGLGNAAGVLGTAAPEPAPVRKNMPPKRKKKKLGGPGRKKANPAPTGDNTPATQQSDVVMTDTQAEPLTQTDMSDIKPDETQNDEAEGSSSDSEGEGSEEGEIEEEGKTQTQVETQPQLEFLSTDGTLDAPQPHPAQDGNILETGQDTADQVPIPATEVTEALASALVPESFSETIPANDFPLDAEMGNATSDLLLHETQATETTMVPDTVPDNIPGLLANAMEPSVPLHDLVPEASSKPAVPETMALADGRPIPEEITPEPIIDSTDIAVSLSTTLPYDANATSQIPLEVSETQTQDRPAEENTPVVSTSAIAQDTDIATSASPIHPQSSSADLDLTTELGTSSNLDILAHTEPVTDTTTTQEAEQTSSGSAIETTKNLLDTKVEAEAAGTTAVVAEKEAELDLLGGLEAAVDKEATTSTADAE